MTVITSYPVDLVTKCQYHSDSDSFILWRDIRGNVLKKSIFCRFRVWKELIFEIFPKPRRAILSSYSCFTRKTECVEWFWVRSDHYSRSLTLSDTRSTKSRSWIPHILPTRIVNSDRKTGSKLIFQLEILGSNRGIKIRTLVQVLEISWTSGYHISEITGETSNQNFWTSQFPQSKVSQSERNPTNAAHTSGTNV